MKPQFPAEAPTTVAMSRHSNTYNPLALSDTEELAANKVRALDSPNSGADSRRTSCVAQPDSFALVEFDDKDIDALGANAAAGLSGVSKKLLGTVRASDADVFGTQLNELIATAKGLAPEKLKNKGLLARAMNLFGSAKENMLAQYGVVESRMDTLVVELENHSTLHSNRINDFESMYNDNYAYHQVLETDVKQGEQWLADIEKALAQQPEAADSFAAQQQSELKRRADRLEKRIDDLRRGMLLAKQMAPQIRLSQDNARALTTTFVDITVVSIPAWRNVFSLYLLQQEAKQSAAVANAAYDATDAAFRAQADMLQQNTESIARLKQRSVVSIETVEHVQKQLISAFDTLDRISEEGRAKRRAELPKLQQMEQELVSRFVPKNN
jgi:uncharacterized protein YaaN involved in tellurite resistance